MQLLPPPTVYVNEASCCQTPVRNLFLLMQHLHVFPFSPWLYYTVFQNMRYKLKIDLEGGGEKKGSDNILCCTHDIITAGCQFHSGNDQ